MNEDELFDLTDTLKKQVPLNKPLPSRHLVALNWFRLALYVNRFTYIKY